MFDLAQIRRIHQTFETKNALMVQRQAEEAGKFAVDYVTAHPTFKPRTGKLQKATGYKVLRAAGGRIVRVKNTAKYAAAIDSGAKPHVIVARRRKTLRFISGGHLVFARRVNHPGNKPFKFLYRATNAAGRILEQSLRAHMGQLARTF
jgi:hypothetical protein